MRAYFPKENLGDLLVDRHRIKIPTLGWVRLIKEKGYIPVNAKVKSCTHSPTKQTASTCFVIVEEPDPQVTDHTYTEGNGLDLGVKYFAMVSNDQEFRNINKSPTVRRVEKRLKSA
jgi:putative transposase